MFPSAALKGVVTRSGTTTVAFANTAKPIGITVDKKVNGGDHAVADEALVVHAGDPLTYTVRIENAGVVPLMLDTLADSLEPGFASLCPKDVGSTLAVGESFTCSYDQTASSGAANTATVVGVDGLGRRASASDSTVVTVISPAIKITKTASPLSVSPGDQVTFTYVVTNTGDTTLTGVAVSDDVLGPIGQVGTLAAGVSATRTRTETVQASTPSRNIGFVSGIDALGKKVTASAVADIAVVLAVVLERPPLAPGSVEGPPAASGPVERQRELPRTGGPVSLLTLGGLALVLLGLFLLLADRRTARIG